MSVEKVFYNLMSNAAGLTALVGTKIYPIQAPQETSYPYIVFRIISTVPTNSKSGVSTMDKVRMQITAVAPTPDQATAIAAQVRAALDFINNQTIETVSVQYITFESENDGFDPNGGLTGGVFLKYQDYFITYSR